MSLDRNKLQKVVRLASGDVKARCPACAEAGNDRKGEHLRISPEGKFGCCVFPGDTEHRKRIFALAGDANLVLAKAIKVRVAQAKPAPALQLDLLGRLAPAFSNPECKLKDEECQAEASLEEVGTPGSPVSDPRAYAEKDFCISKLIGSERPVPSVPVEVRPSIFPESGTCTERKVRLPYVTSSGDLVIPFDAPERYHWWKGGQSIRQTKQELIERKENDASPF